MTWPIYRLEDLTENHRSITYGVVKPGERDPDGVRFIRGGDVVQGKIAVDQLRTITPQVSRKYGRTVLRGGELLVSLVGNPGEVAVVPPELEGANIARQVGLVPLRPKLEARFAMYFLMSPIGRAELFVRTQGSVQQVINLGDLKRVPVPVPDLSVQREVVAILSAYDDLIENNKRRIALLEESARLLYREWFVHLRFPGHEHVAVVDGVPEGWAMREIAELAEINALSLKKGYRGQIEYIDISSVSPGHIDETSQMDFNDAPSRARRKVRHGDIIWSCVRPNRRSHAVIWNPPENLIASTGFAVISPQDVPTSFLYHATTTNLFVGYLSQVARGAAYPAVRAKDFESAEILVPPKYLLDDFDDVVRPTIDLADVLDRQNRQLVNARDLLLPRLMNGEIAV